ncbi:MAG: DUF3179 domain-containing protein [Planctomycetes bacterium]|nr:DUF3179 domain-containing protein [Planctomycetota bacterium]
MGKQKAKERTPTWQWFVVVPVFVVSIWAAFAQIRSVLVRYDDGLAAQTPRRFAPVALSKIRRDGDRQYIWALGSKDPEDDSSEWFDMTDSPLDIEKINHGIGRDTIASIDDPVFVAPDDPRLRERWSGDLDDLEVIGFEHNGDARAYPVALLDHHELVNDTVGGKPVTVGW